MTTRCNYWLEISQLANGQTSCPQSRVFQLNYNLKKSIAELTPLTEVSTYHRNVMAPSQNVPLFKWSPGDFHMGET